MYCILGKTCSGKTTIVEKMIKKYGFNQIVTYTTRPKRKGEKDGITYHFLTNEEFSKRRDEGLFAEWKSYDTVDGVWYYGTAMEDVLSNDDKSLLIVTAAGYKDLVDVLGYTPKSIYIYSNNQTIRKRLQKRGDKKEEIERRIKADNEDFKGVENLVSRIFYNNSDKKLDELVKEIVAYMEK